MPRLLEQLERRQVALYLLAIAGGAALAWLLPASAPVLAVCINPVLGLLLFATFLSVPLAQLGRAFRDARFLTSVVVLNFVVAPTVAYALSRFVADDAALLVGVLLVLLTPCVDYVIVFTGLAGGAKDRLLAATPLLMLLQILLLPLYMLVMAGPATVALFEVDPFVEAFLFLIVLPLLAAGLVQWFSGRTRPPRLANAARGIEHTMHAVMVPLMMATLATVVGSQLGFVADRFGSLLALVPLYAAFIVIMVALGVIAARSVRLEVSESRALVFSGATRNSLVVLPLALALPLELSLAPLAVVTQTLVELVGMVILVKLVPVLVSKRRWLRTTDAAALHG